MSITKIHGLHSYILHFVRSSTPHERSESQEELERDLVIIPKGGIRGGAVYRPASRMARGRSGGNSYFIRRGERGMTN